MKLLHFFLPRLEYILLIAVFWGIVIGGPRILNFDGDLPRHILTGNLILQTHRVPTTDSFSFRTIGYPSIPHEWLSQVLFAVVYNWLGLDGIVLFTALIIMLTWGVVYRQALYKSNSFFSALIITALGVATSQIHVLPRPHIYTYLLTAAWIALLEVVRAGKSQISWTLPVMMLLWVNIHGMFILGLIILSIYLIGDLLENPSLTWFNTKAARSLLIAAGLSLIATFFSPSGSKIWEAIASLGSNAYITSRVPEYQSPNFHMPETWPFIVILLITVIGFARSTKKTSWTDLLMVVSFTGIALYTGRLIPLFAIVVTPITAKALGDWTRSEFPNNRLSFLEENISRINSTANGSIWIFTMVLIAAVLLRSGHALDAEGRGNVFDQRFFPVEAAAWLEIHPQEGHMFNHFDWGGYLLLKLWPNYQIFMDGHTHIYGEALTREYEQVVTLDDEWQKIFKQYNITWAIIPPDWPLSKELRADGWKIVYQDQTAAILVIK